MASKEKTKADSHEVMGILDVVPVEIQMFILSKVDGCSLVQCSRTCHLWHSLATQLMTHLDHWLRICFREISPSLLVDLTGCLALSQATRCFQRTATDEAQSVAELCRGFSCDFWKNVYIRYISHGLVKHRTAEHRKIGFILGVGEATALRLKGSTLVTGHEYGSLMHWWDVFSTVVKRWWLEPHRTRVNTLDIIDIGAPEGQEEAKADKKNLAVVSGSNDRLIMIQCLALKPHTRHVIQHYSEAVKEISSFGRHFTAVGKSIALNEQPVWRLDDIEPESILCSKFFCCQGHRCTGVHTVAMWGNKVYTGDVFGYVSLFDLDTACVMGEVPFTNRQGFGSMPKQVVLQGDNLVVLFVSGSIFVKPEGESHLKLAKCEWMSRFGGLPTKMVLRGALLAIALQAGLVLLYHLPTASDWRSLDFSSPDASVRTSNNNIHALDIGFDGHWPVLVVTGDDKCLEIITFKNKAS